MCAEFVVVTVYPNYFEQKNESFHHGSHDFRSCINAKKARYAVKFLSVFLIFMVSNVLLIKAMIPPQNQQLLIRRELPLNELAYDRMPHEMRFRRDIGAVAALNAIAPADASHPVSLDEIPVRFDIGDQSANPNDDARETQLDDIFIGVKTTQKFHNDRVRLQVDTWAGLARDQTYFFSDAEDEQLSQATGGHFIDTKCPAGHHRRSLCCKMSVEFDAFIRSGRRWFCHADDDTYLNVYRLLHVLREYDHTRPHYLGRPSLNHPLEISERTNGESIQFWFATGGAGVCFSRAMANKMVPYTSNGQFINQCEAIRLPDDVTLGYIVEHLLGEHLTVVSDFHSHLEALWSYKEATLPQMITFSYANLQNPDSSDLFKATKQKGKIHPKLKASALNSVHKRKVVGNVLDVSGYDVQIDPTRFRSAHCHIYDYLHECSDMNQL